MSSVIHTLTLGVVVVLSVLSCGLGEDQVASVTDDKEQSDFSQRTLDSVHVLKKRAPGWGKRSLEDEVNSDDDMSYDSETPEDILSGADLSKRAPGWGKRTLDILEDYTKRAPGWGKRDSLDVKRAPGWGKRDIDMDKRAPGWGKRAPGWGKRAPGWGKRAPGWGKRAPGWGKRAPGWGKRSDTSCAGIDEEVDYYIYRAVQAEARRILECGSKYNGNDVLRK
uniref:APGWamide prepropeptide n=1 Tax=Haliotis discus hannai TaxID=42344 RepID=A0A2R4LUX1_HALDH|nr:APGWamide prepropeptide [Haliotis discus hannai]AZW33616.1 APGWamide prepropeptide [Haliotis discus hannai]